jgi:hypothetical protein
MAQMIKRSISGYIQSFLHDVFVYESERKLALDRSHFIRQITKRIPIALYGEGYRSDDRKSRSI